MTTPNIRAALERLVKAVDHGDTQALADALAHARASLATESNPINWPAYFLRVTDKQASELKDMASKALPGRIVIETEDLHQRVLRLEAMRETERAAVLDLYQQIDRLKRRQDWQYTKIGRLEDAAIKADPA